MQRSKNKKKHREKLLQSKCSKAFCATCRLSVSSSSSSSPDEEAHRVSSIAHAMVQVRLDQMIRERRRRVGRDERERKLVVMVAMEKSSYDPREDFRDSMKQMIVANCINQTKDLRRLLNYYVSMNDEEFRGTILELFYFVVSSSNLRQDIYSLSGWQLPPPAFVAVIILNHRGGGGGFDGGPSIHVIHVSE
ncbi:putative transcription repressor OFP9 [Salvia divinorum]|uniref:Transcription repressor n=1 Tax=Salvia divinorum TaxID=28513 RepID=A0ABD1G2K0_SALDI